MRHGLLALMLVSLPLIAGAACEVRSGPQTAALVELYTSEGCSSCPPADRQLSRLRQSLGPSAMVVPLSLHVDYWDYIGWQDPYAQKTFGQRQSWLVQANQQRTVYTPQFFVGGAEQRAWSSNLLDKVRELNGQPAAASIRIKANLSSGSALQVNAEVTARDMVSPAALYLAVTESGLASSVARGENRGVKLHHDHVVRAWIGPLPLTSGMLRVQREIDLPAAWKRTQLELVAFVQDERSGKVWQAVSAQQCAAS
jgi:hypothetical protein